LKLAVPGTDEVGHDETEQNPVVLKLTERRQAPKTRLALAALGQERLEMSTLEGILAGHVHDLDDQAVELAKTSRGLLEMLAANGTDGVRVDPQATLDLAERFMRLYSVQLGELRKTVDLISRISRPQRSQIKVLAAVSADNISFDMPQLSSLGGGDR
jgi:hypothetical protein